MHQLILTGVASEQQFGSKDTKYLLVFNEGELRVETSEAAVQKIIEAMYAEEPDEPDGSMDKAAGSEAWQQDDQEGPVDEDGIDQV